MMWLLVIKRGHTIYTCLERERENFPTMQKIEGKKKKKSAYKRLKILNLVG